MNLHTSKRNNILSLIFGSAMILAGILFLLKNFGVITFDLVKNFNIIWPTLIILTGISFIFKQKNVGIIILILLLILTGAYYFERVENEFFGEYRELTQTVPLDDITTLELDIHFGAGTVTISKGDDDTLLTNNIKTHSIKDPQLEYKKLGETGIITLSRQNTQFFNKNEEWNITLNPTPKIDLNLDYGVTLLNLDMRGLEVDEISIDSGAVSTKITFDDYPTNVEIDMGVSDMELLFPENSNVEIQIDGGAISVNLKDFTKEGKTYYSPDFKEENIIKINIDAGATSIKGEFY